MSTKQMILSEVSQLKALGLTMMERATHLENLLAGGGKTPVNTRKGATGKVVAQVLANRNKTIQKSRA